MERSCTWSVISNNCWGAGFYQDAGYSYNTPFVGLWLHPDDYLSLLEDFRAIMSSPIEIASSSKRFGNTPYPVGMLRGGIEVQFLHYRDADHAKQTWERRTARLPVADDNLFVKICDRDGMSEAHLERFDTLAFRNKVGFVKRGKFDGAKYPWLVEIDGSGDTVPDGVRLWRVTRALREFDPYQWVGETRPKHGARSALWRGPPRTKRRNPLAGAYRKLMCFVN